MVKHIGALLFLVAANTAFAQSAAFDAASIKSSKIGTDSSSWNSRLGYLVMKNQTLQRLVAIAYGFTDEQRVLGGPKWVGSDRFDVEARAVGPAKDPELLLMLQSLLAERFHLALHRESKNGSGFSSRWSKVGSRFILMRLKENRCGTADGERSWRSGSQWQGWQNR